MSVKPIPLEWNLYDKTMTSQKGPCTYDVRIEGEGGLAEIGQQQGRLRGFSTMEQAQMGTRGSKTQKNCGCHKYSVFESFEDNAAQE